MCFSPTRKRKVEVLKFFRQHKIRNLKLEKPEIVLDLDDITGFVYGGQSTRFWMMRSDINTLIRDLNCSEDDDSNHSDCDILNIPFFAWQCLSI